MKIASRFFLFFAAALLLAGLILALAVSTLRNGRAGECVSGRPGGRDGGVSSAHGDSGGNGHGGERLLAFQALPEDFGRALRLKPGDSREPLRPIPESVKIRMEERRKTAAGSDISAAAAASAKNRLMDELLDMQRLPADYGPAMISLFRDRAQDVLVRDFAVQHIGLYAQALQRRGEYDPASPLSASLRLALFDACGETKSIIPAAALRALADMSAFDGNIDAAHLDGIVSAIAADANAHQASRTMAVQLCGERRIASAARTLEALSGDAGASVPLRLASAHSLSQMSGNATGQ